MSPETLQAAWGFLFPDGRPKKGFSIHLGSGEPLLALSLLRTLAELLERGSGPAEERPAVFLTTNGTLVDGQVGDWLISSGWQVKLSLDGPKPVHDRWRMTRRGGGTFDRVAKAVIRLACGMPDRLSVTAVLCRGADPQEVFDAIASLGVQRIELVPVVHKDGSILPAARDVKRYGTFVEEYARRLLEHAGKEGLPGLVQFESCLRRVMGHGNRRVPCGAGRSFVGVGPDGSLYPCFRFIGLDGYRMGRLSSGLDPEAALAFQRDAGRPYERRMPCRDCWAAPVCGGPCFACSEIFGRGNGQPLDLHCAYKLADARAAVWLVNQLRESSPERLLSFLPHLPEL
jgi:uncharacterized protein